MVRWTRTIQRAAINLAAFLAVLGALDRQRVRARAAVRGGGRAAGGEPRRAGASAPAAGSAEVPDDQLVERVRAEVAMPDGVEVAMVEGAVVLFGRLAALAIEPLLRRVARVPGVSVVEDRLTPVHDLHQR